MGFCEISLQVPHKGVPLAIYHGCSEAMIWVLSGNPARFFYEALGGVAVAERKEAFAGTLLEETAYGWPDLAAWLTSAPAVRR